MQMKICVCQIAMLLVGLLSPTWIAGQRSTAGMICGNPSSQCSSSYTFSSYQLLFQIRDKLIFGKTYKSVQFYSVVLKSVRTNEADECIHISEEERLEVQNLFRDRKVFASRVSCPEELVLYTNVDQEFNFLAVYAGADQSKAKEMLKRVKATARYPQAYLRRMQVVLEFST